MKTGSEAFLNKNGYHLFLFAFLAFTVMAVEPVPVYAQDAEAPVQESVLLPIPDPAAPAPAPQVQTDSPALSQDEPQVTETKAPEGIKLPSMAKEQDFSPVGDGMPGSVKKAIKKLDGAAEGLTLEDLNAAREAVAKLDVLLDIEKRITDLTRVRSEREGLSGASLAAAIPPQALQVPQAAMQMPSQPMAMPASMPRITAPSEGPEKIEVVSIFGASGRYVAVCKSPSGQEVQVEKGDKMEDGSEVESISSQGVTLSKAGKTLILRVKNYSHVPEQAPMQFSSPLPSAVVAPATMAQ